MGGGGSIHFYAAPPHETHTHTHREQRSGACPAELVASGCLSPGCNGEASCVWETRVSVRHMSDGKQHESRDALPPRVASCGCREHYTGSQCEHHYPPAVFETAAATVHETSKPFACPADVAADCASRGCAGGATCFRVTKVTTRQMSDGTALESREEGLPQLQACKCRALFAGPQCGGCVRGAVEHGGECVAAAEKRAQEQRDQLRGMLGKLGHSDRGVDELNGTALERAIHVAAKCERARALADMLGKPARVHRLEQLAENQTAVELLVLSLEEEVGTFWKPHVMGCCAVAVVVVVATVLLVNRCFGRLERTVDPHVGGAGGR